MKVIVQIKNVYGEEKIYPVCESAKAFAAIAGTRTLTLQTMTQIKRLGYSVEVSQTSALANQLALNA